MEDELLVDNMIVYIEKEIAGNFTMEMIMDEFYSMKNRRQAWFWCEMFFFFFFFVCVDIFVYVYSELDSFCMFINV